MFGLILSRHKKLEVPPLIPERIWGRNDGLRGPRLDAQMLGAIAQMFEVCFGQPPDADFAQRVQAKAKLHIVVALENEEMLGFKIGYERFQGVFFSWLGAVTPKHRRAGIATTLMREQHRWCVANGYTEIQTETFGDGAAMLVLNLIGGFEVYGTYSGNDQKVRVQLRKFLQ